MGAWCADSSALCYHRVTQGTSALIRLTLMYRHDLLEGYDPSVSMAEHSPRGVSPCPANLPGVLSQELWLLTETWKVSSLSRFSMQDSRLSFSSCPKGISLTFSSVTFWLANISKMPAGLKSFCSFLKILLTRIPGKEYPSYLKSPFTVCYHQTNTTWILAAFKCLQIVCTTSQLLLLLPL